MLHAPENAKVKLRTEEITIDEAYVEYAKPKRIPRSSYKYPDHLRYPKCLNCGESTISIKKTDCHVHLTILLYYMRMGKLMLDTQLKPRMNAAYYDFIPRPNKEDRKKLKESIKKEGIQIPLILNREGFILDGHTRYEICLELGIENIPTEIKTFPDDTAEKKFVVMTNLARRHLNKFQKIELSWPLFEIEKKRASERENWKTNPDLCNVDKKTGKILNAKKPIKEGLSAVLFGKKIGLGKTLINQTDYLKKNASKELLERCRNGEISVCSAYDLLRGQKLMSCRKIPEKAIAFCLTCNSKTLSPKKTTCHVHKWFCCEHCKWGI